MSLETYQRYYQLVYLVVHVLARSAVPYSLAARTVVK
jgi:hypothetical protein